MNMKKLILVVALIFPLSLFAGDGDDDSSSDEGDLLTHAERVEAQNVLGDIDDDSDDENCRSCMWNNRKSLACALITLLCLGGSGTAYIATHMDEGWKGATEPDPCAVICEQFADYTGQPATDYYDSIILDDIETYTLKPCPQTVSNSGRGRGGASMRGRGGGRGGHSSRKRRGGYSGPRLHRGLPVCTTAVGYTPDVPVNETDADLPDLRDDVD